MKNILKHTINAFPIWFSFFEHWSMTLQMSYHIRMPRSQVELKDQYYLGESDEINMARKVGIRYHLCYGILLSN